MSFVICHIVMSQCHNVIMSYVISIYLFLYARLMFHVVFQFSCPVLLDLFVCSFFN